MRAQRLSTPLKTPAQRNSAAKYMILSDGYHAADAGGARLRSDAVGNPGNICYCQQFIPAWLS